MDVCSECPETRLHAHGMCRRCYGRNYLRAWRLGRNPGRRVWPTPADGHRVCRGCEQELRISEFGPRAAGKDGLQSRCRTCMAGRKRNRRATDPSARTKEQEYEQRPDVARRTRARSAARAYGISPEQFVAMGDQQGGRCAVCSRERKLAVDHCHSTGLVRALLCYPCNIALGQVNDDVDLLSKLIKYLETHR